MSYTPTQLRILSYNVQKSYPVMAALLRDPRVLQYDIIAIQEPWLNSFDTRQTHNPTQGHFAVYVPQSASRALVCLFIKNSIDKSQIRVTGSGATLVTLQLQTKTAGRDTKVCIHNVYNPHSSSEGMRGLGRITEGQFEGISKASVLPALDQALQAELIAQHIAVGDFNLHHEMWYGQDITDVPTNWGSGRRHEPALLITTMERHGMSLCLPPGTITRRGEFQKRHTILDLVWASEGLANRLISCNIDSDLDYNSDHLPVSTSIDLRLNRAQVAERRLFQKIDSEQFARVLSNHLPRISRLQTKEDLDNTVAQLTDALQAAINASVPTARIGPRSIPGFTEECRESIKEVKRARRRLDTWGGEENHRELADAVRHRKACIASANTALHREKVAQTQDNKGLWNLARWLKQREAPSAAFTPDIRQKDGELAQDLNSKCTALQEVFFPEPPEADLADINRYPYPETDDWKPITQHEIREALHLLPADKAPGPDEIPNRILKLACYLMLPLLAVVFNTSLRLQYCPKAFKHSVVVALRKPGKDDYSAPKSYRPIALMNTLGKVLDTVLARRIQFWAESRKLFPETHIGGRKALSCEHGIHLLLEKVTAAWRKKRVASLLLLDVSGAFDNVSHERLLHNLRKRGIHPQLVGWMQSYLQGRTSNIRLAEGTGPRFEIHTGIPQGSPLSPILYLFYNADLLEIGDPESLITGYIDDTSILVEGKNTEETCARLQELHAKAEIWAKKHASVFAPQKYELIHFVHPSDLGKITDTRP